MPQKFAGPRIFTVEQANRVLPQVKQLLDTLKQQREALQVVECAVAVTELEGLQPNGLPSPQVQTKVAADAARHQELVEQFQERLGQLDALGCQLKDLDEGLVDFFTMHQGQLVYLCWRHGEKAIRFWHHIEDGFTGRRPINELANN